MRQIQTMSNCVFHNVGHVRKHYQKIVGRRNNEDKRNVNQIFNQTIATKVNTFYTL